LVTHYHGLVFGLVVTILSDQGEAADVTQEVFLKAFRGIGGSARAAPCDGLYRSPCAKRWTIGDGCGASAAAGSMDCGEDGATIDVEDGGRRPSMRWPVARCSKRFGGRWGNCRGLPHGGNPARSGRFVV
jgi:hypothetical protein